MTRKIIRLGLALLTSVTILTSMFGCSGKTVQETSPAATTAAGTTAASTEVTQKTKEPATYTMYSYSTVIPVDPDNSIQNKTIQEKFGVTFKYEAQPVDQTQGKQKIQVLSATNSLPDVTWIDHVDSYLGMIENGMILDVTQLLEEHGKNILATTSDIVLTSYKAAGKGKLYAIPGQDRPASVIAYARKDWLENLGMQTPKTLDEFEAMLKAFTFNDPDKNGKADTFGYAERNVWGAMFQPVFSAYGVHPWFWQEYNGKLYYGLTHPEAVKGLEKLKAWYQQGLIDTEFITTNTDQWFQKIGLGKGGVCVAGVYTNTKLDGLVQATTPNGSMMKIESPIGPDGKSGITAYGGQANCIVLNSAVKTPERLIEVFDWMATDEGIAMTHYGIEGQDYKLKEGGGVERLISEEEQKKKGLLDLNGRFFNPVRPLPHILDKFITASDALGFQYAEKHAIFDALSGINANRGLDASLSISPTLDADTLLKGMFTVIAGKESPADFQKYVDEWYAGGGTILTENATKIYQELKAQK